MSTTILLWGVDPTVSQEKILGAITAMQTSSSGRGLVVLSEPAATGKKRRGQQWFTLLGTSVSAASVLETLADAFRRVSVLTHNDQAGSFSLQCFERKAAIDRCLLAAEWRDNELTVHGDDEFAAEIEEAGVEEGADLLELALEQRFGSVESGRFLDVIGTMVPYQTKPGQPATAIDESEIAGLQPAVDWSEAFDLWFDFGEEGAEEDDEEEEASED